MKSIVRGGDVTTEVHHERHAAAQDADEQQVAVGIIRADLCTQFPDAGLKGSFVD
jgi:hypothetical protein